MVKMVNISRNATCEGCGVRKNERVKFVKFAPFCVDVLVTYHLMDCASASSTRVLDADQKRSGLSN